LLTAIVGEGGRYRYEGQSGLGSATVVSDGRTKWVYHLHERLYTQQPVSAANNDNQRIIPQEEFPIDDAKQLAIGVGRIPKRLKSAAFLPEDKVVLNGRQIECYVIRYTDEDFKTKPPERKEIGTVWIDKARKVIVKRDSTAKDYISIQGSLAHIPMSEEWTIVYSLTEFDPYHTAGTFTFTPPSDAKLIAEFPTAHFKRVEPAPSELVGKVAPDLFLKADSGGSIRLSSLRGKPVFIEFWATWCGPCVELMPDLVKFYGETSGKGLVWLSVDNDEDPADASDFVSKQHIPWRNYHDEDGSLGAAYRREGIPLAVLIDAEGKVAFYRTGYDISDLREAIAKLGARFAPGQHAK
jgi:thiol-disulfide isomerase/thioredoxin